MNIEDQISRSKSNIWIAASENTRHNDAASDEISYYANREIDIISNLYLDEIAELKVDRDALEAKIVEIEEMHKFELMNSSAR